MSQPHIPDEIRRAVAQSVIDTIKERIENEKLARHTQSDNWSYVMFTADFHEVHLTEEDAALVLALADVRNLLQDEYELTEIPCLDE